MFDKQEVAFLKELFHAQRLEIREEIRTEGARLEKKIVEGVAELLDVSVLPQIADLDRRVTNTEQILKLA